MTSCYMHALHVMHVLPIMHVLHIMHVIHIILVCTISIYCILIYYIGYRRCYVTVNQFIGTAYKIIKSVHYGKNKL